MKTTEDIETWTQVIEPHRKWYKINFKEIWDYRDLIMIFVKRDVVSTYKQTILGPLWLFLAPLFTTITFIFVFQEIAGIDIEGVPKPLFYLAGTTLWNYFQTCLTGTSSTFVQNASIFGKVYFPRLISPISLVISSVVKFGIQFILFLLFFFYYLIFEPDTIHPNSSILLLPILLILMGGISLGLGIIISALTTKYRDLTYFVSFGVSLLMFAAPVVFPISAIPKKFEIIHLYNPIAPLIEAFRNGYTGKGDFSTEGLVYSACFMVVALVVGVILFNKTERNFMDTV